MGLQPFDESTPTLAVLFLASTYTPNTITTLVPAVASRTRIDAIAANSSNTAAINLSLILTRGGQNYFLGPVTLPAATSTPTPMTQVLSFLAPNPAGGLVLLPGDALSVALNIAPTAPANVTIFAVGGSV